MTRREAFRAAARRDDDPTLAWQPLPKEIADQIVDRADGVALFIE